jgi:hypothetical protein
MLKRTSWCFMLVVTVILALSLTPPPKPAQRHGANVTVLTDLITPTCQADVDCNTCYWTSVAIEEGHTDWCLGKAAAVGYCQGNCPSCSFCKVKIKNFYTLCS